MIQRKPLRLQNAQAGPSSGSQVKPGPARALRELHCTNIPARRGAPSTLIEHVARENVVTMTAADSEIRTEERLSQPFQHLGLRRAHLAAGYAAHAVDLAGGYPELVSSLTLVCPTRFDPEPLRPLGSRLLFFHGDRGGNSQNIPRAQAILNEATVVTFPDYADALWSDAVSDRQAEIRAAMLSFLDEISREDSIAPVHIPPGQSEYAGIRYEVRGNGPPLVLLPLNLARSQWDRLVPALAEHYCTITTGGAFLGFVPFLEERMRGGYSAIVRMLVDAADLQPGNSVLEVGCGSGTIARWIARYTAGANHVTAVDVNSYLLREAISLTRSEFPTDRITFREENAEELSFPSDNFDVCLSFTVMEEGDADRMLAEMVRVTRPGGRVGVVVRAADMRFWTNLLVRPELKLKMESAPSAGAAERGCADSSLYRRFVAAGLTKLTLGPQLGPNQPHHGREPTRTITARMLQSLPAQDVEQCRTAISRAIDDGTMLWADPYHCAIGTKPG
jgi:ubiquinone/menaquinone biosynthesis C-methylase UbiE